MNTLLPASMVAVDVTKNHVLVNVIDTVVLHVVDMTSRRIVLTQWIVICNFYA